MAVVPAGLRLGEPQQLDGGGPPNGPSDTATFGPSSQREVNISTSVGLNSIVFAFDSDSFDFSILGGELIISGTGIRQDSGVLQTFIASDGGQIIFNNMATADHAIIRSGGNLLGAPDLGLGMGHPGALDAQPTGLAGRPARERLRCDLQLHQHGGGDPGHP